MERSSQQQQQPVSQYVSQIPMPVAHQQQQPIATKPKGLKKILGKMRRANSGTLHDDKRPEVEPLGGGGGGGSANGTRGNNSDSLRRGGFRASAGSRFAAWMGPNNSAHSATPPPYPGTRDNVVTALYLRGHVQMMSAKFSGFLTTSRLLN